MAGPVDRNDMPRSERGRYQRLINVLESQLTEADATQSEVGQQRERNHRYYALQPMGNEIPGRSHYVSPDVLDVVESKKAYFSRTFLSSRQVVKFKPKREGGQSEADQRTAYVCTQLKKNNWFELLRDFWHDAFVAKRGIILAEWRQSTEEYLQPVQNAPMAQLQQGLQDPRVIDVADEDLQVEMTPQGPVANGSLYLVKDTSKVCLTVVQPEQFFRDPNVGYVRDGAYAGYQTEVTRADMIEMGYDPDQVAELNVEYRWRSEEEDASRKAHDRSWSHWRLFNRPRAIETVTLTKTWTWLDMSDYEELQGGSINRETKRTINTDTLGLYEIHWTRGDILRWADGTLAVREASEIPFFEWTELKVAHAEHGMATADVVSHTQKTNSVLKRLIIDNQQMRNTTRYEAVQRDVKNPRDLLDNRIGGVVWTKRAGSVTPLATPELSPLTFQALEMLARDKEERGGTSRLAQGLNQDAVSNQNAESMIDKLTGLGNERNARAARDFAETFYVPLMQYIYRLGTRHDQQMYNLEAGGSWHTIMPMAWEEDDWEMEVHVALTPEEAQRYAQGLMMLNTMQSQDPQLAPLYQLPQKHAMFDAIYDALGVADSSQFLMRPDDPRVTQAMMQQQQMMMQQKQKMEMLQMQMMQFEMWLKQSDEGRKWYEAQLKGGKLQLETTDRATDNELNREKFKHSKLIDFAELKLEKDQQRAVALGGGGQ